MRYTGLITCTTLVLAYAPLSCLADTANSIPLDRQVDLNLPQKSDPMIKKAAPPKKPKKQISYDGVWLVKRKDDACKSRIGDFKIRIEGQEIVTVVGMSIDGAMQADGKFEMNAKSNYWSIKFNGKLKEKTGSGTWTKTDADNKKCSGAINLTRVDG